MASPTREDACLTMPDVSNTFPAQEMRLVTFLSRVSVMRALAAAAGGAIVGIIVSLIVNIALVELSVSPFFSVYFALLSIFVGCVILWRVSTAASPDPDEAHKKQLIAFSYVVIFSGFLCFFVTKNWFVLLPSFVKIPVYSVLGISVAFALTFTLVDVLNLFVGLFQSSAAKPLVQSVPQVRLVVATAVLMGAIFGTIFGLLDVEDTMASYVRLAMMREEHYCYPIGAVLGAAAGFGTEYLRKTDVVRQRTYLSAFDDDI